MSSIKHISINLFESRVSLTKSEQAHPQGKLGIREYTDPFIQFFAVLFGLAVNLTYKGQIFCLNKQSFREWVERNLEKSPPFDEMLKQASVLVADINLPSRFAVLEKEIKQLQDAPQFVKKLCEQGPSHKSYQELKVWRKARDVLTVWKEMAHLIQQESPDQEMLDTLKDWEEISKAFPSWCQVNKQKFLSVKELSLENKGLKKLPEEIFLLKKLIKLNLSGNFLKELPSEIGNLTILNRLDLSGNQLNKLPQEICMIDYLEELFLEYNQFQVFPKEIFKLEYLITLNLSGNFLKELPKEIGKLYFLLYFYLWQNQLKELPKEIYDLNLLVLDLSGNELEVLPEGIINLKDLEELNLSGNKLKELSIEMIAQLKDKGVNVRLKRQR